MLHLLCNTCNTCTHLLFYEWCNPIKTLQHHSPIRGVGCVAGGDYCQWNMKKICNTWIYKVVQDYAGDGVT